MPGLYLTAKAPCGFQLTQKERRHKGAFQNNGRGGEIRTRDHYTPSVVRYQAALRPDKLHILTASRSSPEALIRLTT
jgi:hypothetical protein